MVRMVCVSFGSGHALAQMLHRGSVDFLSTELVETLGCTADEFRAHTHVQIDRAVDVDGAVSLHHGVFVFRHPRMQRTCELPFKATVFARVPHTDALCHVHSVQWCDDAEPLAFLAVLEARLRLGVLGWKTLTRRDTEYIAVRSAAVGTLGDAVRHHLVGRRCVLNHNVSYTNKGGTFSHRSLLLPLHLVPTRSLSTAPARWSIVTLAPHPVHHMCSEAAADFFGWDRAMEPCALSTLLPGIFLPTLPPDAEIDFALHEPPLRVGCVSLKAGGCILLYR